MTTAQRPAMALLPVRPVAGRLLGGTVFTGWDIVLILLLYVGLPLLVLVAVIVGVVMVVRRTRR